MCITVYPSRPATTSTNVVETNDYNMNNDNVVTQEAQEQQGPSRSRPLPSKIVELLEGIRWGLDPSLKSSAKDYRPFHYETIEKMRQIRVKEHQQDPTSFPLLPDVLELVKELVEDMRKRDGGAAGGTGNATCSRDDGEDYQNEEYLARMIVSCVILGHGYADEAHAFVAPLSWCQATPFAYGPVVALRDPAQLAVASYIHCLVHRREGPNPSEFGMTGFVNSGFWTSATMRSGGEETIPWKLVRDEVRRLATHHAATSQGADRNKPLEWFQDLVFDSSPWEPRFLTELCEKLYYQEQGEQQQQLEDGGFGSGAEQQPQDLDEVNVEMRIFAERAARAELLVLLGHTLELAGYDASAVRSALFAMP